MGTVKNCYQCQHLSLEIESEELAGKFDYHLCKVTNCHNLSSFPFRHTKCKKFLRVVNKGENPFKRYGTLNDNSQKEE